jgi:hypothetical protein
MPPSKEHHKRRGRNYLLGGALLALVALFYVITLVKF